MSCNKRSLISILGSTVQSSRSNADIAARQAEALRAQCRPKPCEQACVSTSRGLDALRGARHCHHHHRHRRHQHDNESRVVSDQAPVCQCGARRSRAQMESAVFRVTISQKVSSVNVMQDEALHRRSQLSLGPRYFRISPRSGSADGPRG